MNTLEVNVVIHSYRYRNKTYQINPEIPANSPGGHIPPAG
jgi:hypothetical protein